MIAEDITAGYKQLLEVERGWRDMKSVLDLRPVCHRLEEPIRAHVLFCWLALLLVRVAKNQAGQTWPATRRELQRISIGTFIGPAGAFPAEHRHPQDSPRPARGAENRRSPQDPRAQHTRELIRALHDEPPPRDTARG